MLTHPNGYYKNYQNNISGITEHIRNFPNLLLDITEHIELKNIMQIEKQKEKQKQTTRSHRPGSGI